MKWNDEAKRIAEILKLRTPPVGVRFYEKNYEPDKAFKPSKYGIQMAVCQAIALVRSDGAWTLSKFLTVENGTR